VAKFNATGNGLVFSTFLGGNGYDVGVDIAVDAAGNTYITGHTYSEDFPVTANTYQSTYGGGSYDAFMTKLSSKGNKLDFSTYLGGNETDGGGGIAVDAARNTYITGVTKRDFPVTANAYQSTHGGGSFDAFVIKFSYSGFFYPTGGETLTGTVAVQWTAVQDASGILYSLFYSSDAGTSWYALAVDYSETMYAWDTTTVPDGSGYLLKVIAINATGHTTEYISDNTFSIQNTPSSSVTPSSAHTSESGIPTTASPGWTVGIFLTLILTIFFYRKYKRRNQESS
ncbi:MAG: SBBP repeat-containing protein, partial [Candidatus Hodarchaeota archaeon]